MRRQAIHPNRRSTGPPRGIDHLGGRGRSASRSLAVVWEDVTETNLPDHAELSGVFPGVAECSRWRRRRPARPRRRPRGPVDPAASSRCSTAGVAGGGSYLARVVVCALAGLTGAGVTAAVFTLAERRSRVVAPAAPEAPASVRAVPEQRPALAARVPPLGDGSPGTAPADPTRRWSPGCRTVPPGRSARPGPAGCAAVSASPPQGPTTSRGIRSPSAGPAGPGGGSGPRARYDGRSGPCTPCGGRGRSGASSAT